MPEKVTLGVDVTPEVKAAVKRLAAVEGQSQGDFITMIVDAWDKGEVPAVPETDEAEDMTIPVPRDRKMLAQVVLNIVVRASKQMTDTAIIAGITTARQRFLHGLPEYIEAEEMRKQFRERREVAGHTLSYTKKGQPLSS